MLIIIIDRGEGDEGPGGEGVGGEGVGGEGVGGEGVGGLHLRRHVGSFLLSLPL